MFFCRLVLVSLFLFGLAAPVYAGGISVDVKVKGVKGKIKDNVLSSLNQHLQRNNARLKASTIRRLHKKAEKYIRQALEPYGYYHPTITSHLSEDDDGFYATYEIDKGPPIIIVELQKKIVGEGRENRALLAAFDDWRLAVGDVLDQESYEKEKKKLINTAMSEGFLDVRFLKKKVEIDTTTNRASVSLIVDTKKRYYFGLTRCKQEKLDQDLLDKYIPYRQGDPYRSSKLFELQSILYETNYFRQVRVQGRLSETVDHKVPVEVDLQSPEKRNKYSVGLGYATNTGARLTLDWSNRLFNSSGHKVRASLLAAEEERGLKFLYETPGENPRYDSINYNLGYQDISWGETDTRLVTAAISREHSGPRFKLGVGLEGRDEVYDVGNTSGHSTLVLPSLNAGFVLADNILNTSRGLSASVNLLGAHKDILSDASFLQVTLNGKGIYSPWRQWRVLGRISVGGTLVDSIDSLPPSLRYYTGGDATIRGYSYKSIGTKDSSGTVIGGRYLIAESIELEYAFTPMWAAAVFWDAGTAEDSLSIDWSHGVGVGVRFRLPFGQIRLDVASAVSEDGSPVRVHLSVGGDL